jgi:hypothetical protein
MSDRVVAVTALLIDVLDDLEAREDLTPAEVALGDVLYLHLPDLQRIHALALAEMQALAPAVLAAEPLASTG